MAQGCSVVLLIVLCASLVPSPGFAGQAEQETAPEDGSSHKPIVRVMSPGEDGVGFVLDTSKSKMIISLEIVDVEGVGIETDDSGMPRFFDRNSNVDVFLHHIVTKGNYTNGRGQTVTQLISEIPINQLVADKSLKITPPIDAKNLTKKQEEEGIEIPPTAMVQIAAFYFKVKDRNGEFSGSEETDATKKLMSPTLSIGFASQVYHPASESKDAKTASTP